MSPRQKGKTVYDTLSYEARCMLALEHQMPTMWHEHRDLVMSTWQQTGGFCMALMSDVDPKRNTYRMLTEEDGTFYVFQYSNADVDDEGIEVLVTDDVKRAVATFTSTSHGEW